MNSFPLHRYRFSGEERRDIPKEYWPHLGELLNFLNEKSNVLAVKGFHDSSERKECLASTTMFGKELVLEWIEYRQTHDMLEDPLTRQMHLVSVGEDGWHACFTYTNPFEGALSRFIEATLAGDGAAFVRDMTMLRTVGITPTSLPSAMTEYAALDEPYGD